MGIYPDPYSGNRMRLYFSNGIPADGPGYYNPAADEEKKEAESKPRSVSPAPSSPPCNPLPTTIRPGDQHIADLIRFGARPVEAPQPEQQRVSLNFRQISDAYWADRRKQEESSRQEIRDSILGLILFVGLFAVVLAAPIAYLGIPPWRAAQKHKAIEKLIAETDHPDASIRLASCRALNSRWEELSFDERAAIDRQSLPLLRHTSPEVRVEACKLYRGYESLMEEALGDMDAKVRLEACRALSTHGEVVQATMDKLQVVATSDGDADVRAEAERAIRALKVWRWEKR